MFRAFLSAAAVLFGFVAAVPAVAHITAHPESGLAGSTFETEFDVSHGCQGSATVSLTLKIPAEVVFVRPRLKPGWTITIKTRELKGAAPSRHGAAITKTADEITWRGGPLPNDMYDGFRVRMRLPDQPGATLYFPIVQQCQKGVHRWIEVPGSGQGWSDMREPPPYVKVLPKAP